MWWQRILVVGVLCGPLMSGDGTAHGASSTIAEHEWIRPAAGPYGAMTPAEKLAAKVMSNNLQPVSDDNLTARYLGEDRYYSLVEVTATPETPSEAYKVETFRMLGTRIAASTAEYRQETETVSTTRQQNAYDTAVQFYRGTLPIMPLVYEGKYTYRPKKGDKCEVIVDELSTNRELLQTYTIDVCQ